MFYYDDFVGFLLVIVVIFGIVVGTWLLIKDENEYDHKMRQDYSDCMKAGKEWVFKYDTGLDGVCVTKK